MKDVVLEAERETVGSRRVFRILIRGGKILLNIY